MPSFTFEYLVFSLIALIVIAIFFYVLYKKLISSREEMPSQKLETKEQESRWYDFLKPQIPWKIRYLKHERKHKITEKEHHDFFREFGEETKKIDNAAFNKLKRVVKHHKGTKKIFQNLEEVAEKLKEEEKKLAESEEIKGSISKLKGMFGK